MTDRIPTTSSRSPATTTLSASEACSTVPVTSASLCADGFVSVDLAAASHSAVIVDVRVEFPGTDQASGHGLVISRGHCKGNRPHAAALYREARELVRRLNTQMGRNAQAVTRVLAHVAGRPVPIFG